MLVDDFNARTAEEQDLIYIEENDFAEDFEGIVVNEVCTLDLFKIPRNRKNMDKTKNRFGNQLLDFCKSNNVFVMNGRLQNDHEGNLTCRNASLVDYVMLTFYRILLISMYSNFHLYTLMFTQQLLYHLNVCLMKTKTMITKLLIIL